MLPQQTKETATGAMYLPWQIWLSGHTMSFYIRAIVFKDFRRWMRQSSAILTNFELAII